MAFRPIKSIKNIFNALGGKWGPKPAVWTGLAIAAEGAAIGLGVAVVVSSLPLSAAFFAASIGIFGISSAMNAAGGVSNHKRHANEQAREQRILDTEQRLLDTQEDLVRAQQQLLKALGSSQPASPPKPA